MKRKHIPGCYCCDIPPEECPNCCDPEEVIPASLSPSPGLDLWTRIARQFDEECCCLTERWIYNNSEPVKSCCEEMKYDKWTTTDTRIDHALALPSAYFLRDYGACPPISCPDSEEDCCVQEDYKVAEWKETIEGTHTHYFAVDFFLDSIDITWTREIVRCPDQNPNDDITEPRCRYVMKIAVSGRWQSRINTHLRVESVAENVYHHPCRPVSPECTPGIPNCTQIFEGCNDEEFWCEASEQVDTGFSPVDHPCEPGPYKNCDETKPTCQSEIGFFCVERIKYFDEAPTGLVTFTSADVIEENPFDPDVDCDEPVCRADCTLGGYFTSIVVQSPADFAPPCWCTEPPTIETYTVSNVMEFSWCGNALDPEQAWLLDGQVCCGEDPSTAIVQCDPVPCENPITIETTCDRLVWEGCEPDEGCQFNSRFGPLLLCGVAGIFPWNLIFNTNTRIADCASFSPINGGLTGWASQLDSHPCFAGSFPGFVPPCPPEGTPEECCQELICTDPLDPTCDGRCLCYPLFPPAGFVKSLETELVIDCEAYEIKQCTYDIPQLVVEVEF